MELNFIEFYEQIILCLFMIIIIFYIWMLPANCSSVGITVKTLLKTPIFCDGSTLVMLTTPPGGSIASTARSLFGSSPNLASLRCKLVSLFSLFHLLYADCWYFEMLPRDNAGCVDVVLASNNWYSVEDGQFISRIDLIDAPNSALSRGASLTGLGTFFFISFESCIQTWHSKSFKYV